MEDRRHRGFARDAYTIRRSVIRLFGASLRIFDSSGDMVFYSRMKAFTLREDIRLYTGEDMQTEVLRISARHIVDFAAAYDVTDAATGERVGAVRRRGLKSLVRDRWTISDAADREIGTVHEDSAGLAIMRRLTGIAGLDIIANVVAPQKYLIDVHGRTVATAHHNRNPFAVKLTLDFTPDTGRELDRRLGLAAGLLLATIEGKQG